MRYERLLSKADTSVPRENATMTAIIRAATELFLQKGYHNVSMREIAAKANVNLGLIPYYFGSKGNLANKVYTELTNDMYTELFQKYHLDDLSSAVQMYVYTVLTLEQADDNFNRFFCEYSEACRGNENASEVFIQMSLRVIRDYKVSVTPTENEIYLVTMKGAERLLNIKRQHHELNISTRQILNIILSNYLYNIGLSDREIAQIIKTGNDVLDRLNV